MRLPGYCAGCPHRGTDSVIKHVRKNLRDADFLTMPDIGCYSMSIFTPWREAHAFNAMGHAGASADAMRDVVNKKIVLIGDGTFEHGGKNSVQEAIDENRDRISIIMDNKCVAMTGHQRSVTTEYNRMRRVEARRFEPVVRGMAQGHDVYIKTIDPDDRRTYIQEIKRALKRVGPTVFISEKECGITHERRRKMTRVGPKTDFVNVTPEVCENCRECTMNTGCPGLTLTDTPYGQKVTIDMSICTEDVYCARIEACPSFERVKVSYAGNRPRQRLDEGSLKDIAEPVKKVEFDDMYSIYTGSFGGLGGGLNSVILARAAAKQGYNKGQWIGHDKKGLAVRNGGVYSHVIFSKNKVNISPVITAGTANLIDGLDKLEGTRGLKYANEHTWFVSNETELPTIPMLVGEEDYPADVDFQIKAKVGELDYFGLPVSELCEFYLGSKIYSNIAMLGVIYQLGLLPIERRYIEEAIVQSAKSGKDTNLKAFNFGRKLVANRAFAEELASNPDFLLIYDEKEWLSRRSTMDVLNEKSRHLEDYYLFGSKGRKAGLEYLKLMDFFRSRVNLDDDAIKGVAIRVYDLMKWGNFDYAKKYVDLIMRVYDKDGPENGYEATKAVVNNLYKVMAIKDELWVAELLLSTEKLNRDKVRYNVDTAHGDIIEYVHLNRPQIDIHVGRRVSRIVDALRNHIPNLTRNKVEIDASEGQLKVRFNMNTSSRSLRLIRRMKFLRRLAFRHEQEEEFRDWYMNEVVECFLRGFYKDYGTALEALKMPLELRVPNCPVGVTGFREVVYPKMRFARYAFSGLITRTEDPLKVVGGRGS